MTRTFTGSTATFGAPTAPPRQRRWPMWLAFAVAIAALNVGVFGLVRDQQTAPAPAAEVTAPLSGQEADRQLCEAVGPLLQESVVVGKRFVALGRTGSLARDNGIPGFQAAVRDWQTQIQPILDRDPGPPRFLLRATQRYVDDLALYALNIGPGEGTAYDELAWNDGTVAMGAAVAVCGDLGVRWWTG